MTDYAQAYREARGRVSALVQDAGDERLETIAPATPEWRVKDIVAHLTGVTADITSGNLAGVATDAWTAKQVDDRRDRTIVQLLDEWDEKGTAVEAMVPQFPEAAAAQMLGDAATHEHDIRGALGAFGARDSDAIAIGFEWMTKGIAAPLRLETDAGTFITGDGEPEATVRADRFELFRAMTGRRSLDQIRAYAWDGDLRPEALVLGIFTARPEPLVE
jgi:uncharacterized protein (TIGR03083 family)